MNPNLLAERNVTESWIYAGVVALVFLVLMPILLFFLGRVFGAAVLSLTQRETRHTFLEDAVMGAVGFLYQIVIIVSILYFYISLPIFIFSILSIISGNVYLLFLTPERIENLALVRIGLLIFGFVVIVAFVPFILAAFFSKANSRNKLRLLSRDEAPKLWEMLEEVAQRVNTRSVDIVSINSGTLIGVIDHGNIIQRLRGHAQRELQIGLGVLPGMTQSQLKAILAHEYGHFSKNDTSGLVIAHQVQTSIDETVITLREQADGSSTFLWTVFLYFILFLVRLYYVRVFLPVLRGAARIKELRADRFAALAYGGKNFSAGLEHIVLQTLTFNMQLQLEEQEARKLKRRLQNLYTLPPLNREAGEKLSPLFEEAMKRVPSIYDSHPAPNHRIRTIEMLNIDDTVSVNTTPVWELFIDAEAIQNELTASIQRIMYTHYGHSWAK